MILPEGYTTSELSQFHSDARATIARLLASDGFRDHMHQINVWYQDIRSAQSGISDPSSTIKRTAFDVAFGNGVERSRRCLMPSSAWSTVSVANLLRLGRAKSADSVIILANTDEYGGCANYGSKFLVMSAHQESPSPGDVLAHELGHALFQLGDEYSEEGRSCDATHPNLSTRLQQLPWKDLIAPTTPIPTIAGQSNNVGAYEGGGYCKTGVYRPQPTCKMRQVTATFCAVCRREMERTFARRATESGCTCQDVLQPVCGSDGNTYDNACRAGCAGTTVRHAAACTCHPGRNGTADHCSAACPCDSGYGDCDSNAECKPGLHCAQDVGAQFGFPDMMDVCI